MARFRLSKPTNVFVLFQSGLFKVSRITGVHAFHHVTEIICFSKSVAKEGTKLKQLSETGT